MRPHSQHREHRFDIPACESRALDDLAVENDVTALGEYLLGFHELEFRDPPIAARDFDSWGKNNLLAHPSPLPLGLTM